MDRLGSDRAFDQPDEFGKFSLIFGLLGLLSVVTDLGVGRVVLAKLVECNPWEVSLVTTAFISLRVALGLFGYIVAVGYVWILRYPAEVVEATAVAGLVVVVATPSHALSVMYQSRLRMTYVAIAEASGNSPSLSRPSSRFCGSRSSSFSSSLRLSTKWSRPS